ncbi:MAG: endonuclease III [Bacteroidia bacterium]|nr:endonuclease III [Bacteroidia bacterium]
MASPTLFHTESLAQRRGRMGKVLRALRTVFPAPACALVHDDPLQLLIATILSAQCTDERVNMVTPSLFAAWPTARALADADVEEIAEVIRSTGFFQNKSRNIKACCQRLMEVHDGEVPRTMEELTALPGVGRKTANVVLGNAFGIPGFPVDTHVTRISNLLELTDSDDPVVIERHLCEITPKKHWTDASHLFILHGRATCIARRPRCGECVIARWCPASVKSEE